MDSVLQQYIDNLHKSQEQFSTENLIDMEKCLRKFKTELFIKGNQVEYLKRELHTANEEIIDLKQILDHTKRLSDGRQFNLDLLQEKVHDNENQLKEIRQEFSTINLQYKLMMTENASLKETAQKIGREKVDLVRNIHIIKEKHKYDSMCHNEILKHDTQLRSLIGELQQTMTKLHTEQSDAIDLLKHLTLAENAQETSRFLYTFNEKLQLEKNQFEDKFIKINVKYRKIKEFMNNQTVLNETDLFSKVIFNQWKLAQNHYNQEINMKNKTLNNLSEIQMTQKNTITKLYIENEELVLKVHELERKLKQTNIKTEHDNMDN